MRKYLLILVTLSALWIAGCKHPTDFKEIQVPAKFTIQVPVYMHAASDLFAGGNSTLQYESDSMQVYLLVFDTGRTNLNEKTLRQYYDALVSKPSIKAAHIMSPRPALINNDSALVSQMSGIVNNIPVFYRIEVIATAKRFYYILLWCRQDGRIKLKEDFDKVLGSFTDINHSKV